MYDAPLTDDEAAFRAHYLMFGSAAVVSKLGTRWQVWAGRPGFPLRRTKREAMETADAYARALATRHARTTA